MKQISSGKTTTGLILIAVSKIWLQKLFPVFWARHVATACIYIRLMYLAAQHCRGQAGISYYCAVRSGLDKRLCRTHYYVLSVRHGGTDNPENYIDGMDSVPNVIMESSPE